MTFCLSCPVISWKQRIQKDQPPQWFNANYYPNADPGCVAANSAFNVSVGSKTEVTPLKRQVRSTLRSGHRQATAACPFRANSGHPPDTRHSSDRQIRCTAVDRASQPDAL